jgi:hypothetical protein
MGFLFLKRCLPIAVVPLLLAQPAPLFAAACAGADPAVVSVVVKGMKPDGNINRYTLSGRVVNLGSSRQDSNTLQFVEIYRGSTKIDSRGVPPLRPGQSYTFEYVSSRSAQSGAQTTALGFRMSSTSQSCNADNGTTMVRF